MPVSTRAAMKADTYRQYGQFSWGLTIKGAIARRTFRVVVTMRLWQAVANSLGMVRLALPFFRIGRGNRIVGGAFLSDSVPPYSIVSGNPATIVKSNCVPDVMNPAPL